MNTPEEETQVYELPTTTAPKSVFDMLRAKRAEHTAMRQYDVDVGGYGGMLVVRCGPIASAKLAALRTRYERSKAAERDFHFAADVLIAACTEVLWRELPDGELQSFNDEEPMVLDERLADGLGLEGIATGRDLVRALYDAAPSPDLALTSVVNGYIEWASDVSAAADEAFVGESPAAPR